MEQELVKETTFYLLLELAPPTPRPLSASTAIMATSLSDHFYLLLELEPSIPLWVQRDRASMPVALQDKKNNKGR